MYNYLFSLLYFTSAITKAHNASIVVLLARIEDVAVTCSTIYSPASLISSSSTAFLFKNCPFFTPICFTPKLGCLIWTFVLPGLELIEYQQYWICLGVQKGQLNVDE